MVGILGFFFDLVDDDCFINIRGWLQSVKSRLDWDNSVCFTGFTMKAYRISFSPSLSFMRSYKSPEPQLCPKSRAQTPSDTNWCFTETNCREQQDLPGPAPTSGEAEDGGEARREEMQNSKKDEAMSIMKDRKIEEWTRHKRGHTQSCIKVEAEPGTSQLMSYLSVTEVW